MTDPIAIILAGGGSRRMGSDKATMELGGRPMIEWVAEAAGQAFDAVAIVGRSKGLAGIEALADAGPPHLGPLSGIATALAAFQRPIVAVAVDQPFVRAETLSELAHYGELSQAAVPVADDWEQVTCGRYPLEWVDEAHQELHNGGNIRNMLRRLPWTRVEQPTWSRWGEDGRSWFSIDSPADIVTAEQRFRLNLH